MRYTHLLLPYLTLLYFTY